MIIKCSNCNYKWDSYSKLDNVTCPNCQKKFKKETKEKKQEEEKIIWD